MRADGHGGQAARDQAPHGTLLETKVDKSIRVEIDRLLGKRVSKYIEEQEREVQRAVNQWALYSIISYYISHMIKRRLRASYQLQAGRIYGL